MSKNHPKFFIEDVFLKELAKEIENFIEDKIHLLYKDGAYIEFQSEIVTECLLPAINKHLAIGITSKAEIDKIDDKYKTKINGGKI